VTEVWFYHLESARLEGVLPDLLEKTLARGWRAVVRAGSPDRVAALDSLLWTYAEESFLPHAAEGEAEAARQPIWITHGEETPNEPDLLFLVDGADAEPASLSAFKRCVAIFDGRDQDAVADARAFWKAAKGAGCDVTYWRQSDSGRWEKQA